MPEELAYSFLCEEGQKVESNKRLPGITQRDVSPSDGSSNLLTHPETNHTLSRSGSRLLPRFVVMPCVETIVARSPEVRAKAAPLQLLAPH